MISTVCRSGNDPSAVFGVVDSMIASGRVSRMDAIKAMVSACARTSASASCHHVADHSCSVSQQEKALEVCHHFIGDGELARIAPEQSMDVFLALLSVCAAAESFEEAKDALHALIEKAHKDKDNKKEEALKSQLKNFQNKALSKDVFFFF